MRPLFKHALREPAHAPRKAIPTDRHPPDGGWGGRKILSPTPCPVIDMDDEAPLFPFCASPKARIGHFLCFPPVFRNPKSRGGRRRRFFGFPKLAGGGRRRVGGMPKLKGSRRRWVLAFPKPGSGCRRRLLGFPKWTVGRRCRFSGILQVTRSRRACFWERPKWGTKVTRPYGPANRDS